MRVCRARQLPACTGLPSYSAYSVYYPHTHHTCPQSAPASYQLSKCGANVAVISKEFPGLPIVRMLEAWVVKVELQWHTETDGVGIAALLHTAAVSVFPAMVSSAVIGLCSHFLQTARCRIWSAALQSACSTDCSTEAWWAGLLINLQLGRGDRES